MKKTFSLFILSFTLITHVCVAQSISDKVEQLINKMTIEEKVGQMTQLNITVINNTGEQRDVELNKEKAIDLIKNHHIGSFLNGEAVPASTWYNYMNDLMHVSVENSRLGIPIIYGIDHMHGASYIANSTIFPHNINIGATFNVTNAENNARITGIESADLGHHWVFAPVLDLGRNPLWPRLYETYGEDPYLAAQMGGKYVYTLQNNPDTKPYKQAATGKHFLGYSDPKGGWDRTPAHIPDQEIYEFFGPSFKAAFDNGLSTIMVNSGEINGIAVHASKGILTDLLRDYYGFEGVIVTDWADIDKLVTYHHVAENFKEATYLSVTAGIDMSMTPYDLTFNEALLELVDEGRISEERINESVRRILTLKFNLGLFDNPYPSNKRLDLIGSEEHKNLAYEAAVESIVLLKNKEDVLPLSSSEINNILVIGPSADSKRNLNGGWTLAWQGGTEERYPDDVETIYDGIKRNFPDATVNFATEINDENREQVLAWAESSDVIMYALGETPYTEMVGNINTLLLPDEQRKMVELTKNVDAKKILVLVEGRPRIITDLAETMDAVLFAGLPGNEGGKAVADILSGQQVPSGKMSITYPKYAGAFFPYNHKTSVYSPDYSPDAEQQESYAQMNVETTLYPFGYGLSYTTFKYSDLKLASSELKKDGSLTAEVTVTNTGDVAGKEAVLWYLTDQFASISRPVKELRHFEKIELAPGESKTVSFTINPDNDLSFPDKNGTILLETGAFFLTVDDLSAEFNLID